MSFPIALNSWPSANVILIGIALALAAMIGVSLYQNGKRGWGWVVVGMLTVVLLMIVYLLEELLQLIWYWFVVPGRSWWCFDPDCAGIGDHGCSIGGDVSCGGGGAMGTW